jgi:hypothetical protein
MRPQEWQIGANDRAVRRQPISLQASYFVFNVKLGGWHICVYHTQVRPLNLTDTE